jgi:hypothetical protein
MGDATMNAPKLTVPRMAAADPLHGPRIQDLGDSAAVCFRARRSWALLTFLAFWLILWTFGGTSAMGGLWNASWEDRAFLALWLCGWVLGEGMVSTVIAWQLVGRERLVVTLDQLEVRREIGPFALNKRVPSILVESVRARLVPVDEDERPRSDFCLEISAGGKEIRVGHSMSQIEAEHVASLVMERVRPRPRWGDESNGFRFDDNGPKNGECASADTLAVPSLQFRSGRTSSTRRAGLVLFGALVAVVLVALGLDHRRSGETPQSSPGRVPATAAEESVNPDAGPPSRTAFSDPHAYASAMTRFALRSARIKLAGRPVCDENSMWDRWTCRVTATPLLGPYAGRRLKYRCSPSYEPQPGGRPAVLVINCGLENPPPLTT